MSKTVRIDARKELSSILSARIMVCDIGRQEHLAEIMPLLKAIETQSFFLELPSYQQQTSYELEIIQSETEIHLAVDYEDETIENNSVAYHRMKGTIYAESRWWGFSSKQFEKDLIAADANPRIVAHFIHTNSGGGDAWYNDRVAETMQNLTKPVINYTERVMASAALFQNAYATKRYASTPFDTIGSIGTMVSYLNFIPYYEKEGAKWIEEYATNSKEKNARIRELEDGKPKRFKEQDLDPLRNNFAQTMRDAIPAIAKLDENDPLMQGTTVYTEQAIEYGLIDGIKKLEEAVQEAYDLGMAQKQTKSQFSFFNNKALNILNS